VIENDSIARHWDACSYYHLAILWRDELIDSKEISDTILQFSDRLEFFRAEQKKKISIFRVDASHRLYQQDRNLRQIQRENVLVTRVLQNTKMQEMRESRTRAKELFLEEMRVWCREHDSNQRILKLSYMHVCIVIVELSFIRVELLVRFNRTSWTLNVIRWVELSLSLCSTLEFNSKSRCSKS
jgi:hypothetical protein